MNPLARLLCVLSVASLPHVCALAADTVKPGVLTVGTVTTYPPMAYKDPATGSLAGVEVELAKAVAAELGMELQLVEVSFAQLLPSLQTGRIDIAMAGMADRPARREVANFIDYIRSGAQFYTLADKAAAIGGMENMCGKSVAYSRGAMWDTRIAEWSKTNCEAKGKPAVVVVGAENSADARTQLLSGRVDAAVQGSDSIGYLQNIERGKFVKVGTIFSEYLIGMPFLKGNAKADALMERVKKAMAKLQENGKYDAILAKFGIEENSYKPLTVNKGT